MSTLFPNLHAINQVIISFAIGLRAAKDPHDSGQPLGNRPRPRRIDEQVARGRGACYDNVIRECERETPDTQLTLKLGTVIPRPRRAVPVVRVPGDANTLLQASIKGNKAYRAPRSP